MLVLGAAAMLTIRKLGASTDQLQYCEQ